MKNNTTEYCTTFENNKKLPKPKSFQIARLLDIEGRKYNKWGNANSIILMKKIHLTIEEDFFHIIL
jgi:hypothetical protein